MREGTCAVIRIKCPVYTKTGMSRPVLEEFFNRKMNENPFGCSMQKYTHMYSTCIVLWLFCCVSCTVVVLICFVMCVCVCVCVWVL